MAQPPHGPPAPNTRLKRTALPEPQSAMHLPTRAQRPARVPARWALLPLWTRCATPSPSAAPPCPPCPPGPFKSAKSAKAARAASACRHVLAVLLALAAPLLALPALAQTAANSAQPAAAQACPPTTSVPAPADLKAAAERAQDHGALWRLSRAGRVSWLYGTLHLGKLDWSLPGPLTRQALLASDLLALEIDISAPTLLAELAEAGRNAAPVDWPAALTERLARQRAAACLPPGALADLHPLLQATTLSGLDARWIGLDPGYGVEFVLTGFMRSLGRPVTGLETLAQQLAALLPERPADGPPQLAELLDQLESGQARQTMARLGQAWADGDLDTIGDHARWCQCVPSDSDRRRLVRLNDARNPPLADRLLALHDQGQRVFAAIGALHMTGPQALPRLLAERGFQVERVR